MEVGVSVVGILVEVVVAMAAVSCNDYYYGIHGVVILSAALSRWDGEYPSRD